MFVSHDEENMVNKPGSKVKTRKTINKRKVNYPGSTVVWPLRFWGFSPASQQLLYMNEASLMQCLLR